jgi:hypothetical protein
MRSRSAWAGERSIDSFMGPLYRVRLSRPTTGLSRQAAPAAQPGR